jgi:uncharacterized caspase-like protein
VDAARWKNSEIEVDAATGKKRVTLHGIKLPRKVGLKEVEFSAYAFNVDRVKSETARRKFPVPQELVPRPGRAYLVSIGVNAFQNAGMGPLSYAANDAKALNKALQASLATVHDIDPAKTEFAEVIPITLVSAFGTDAEAEKLVINQATKDRIKAVIEKLAGKSVEAARLEGIANADRLQAAQPEDLVLIAFSTHGDVGERGQFYIMPYDLGPSLKEADIRAHAISSEELSAWLRTLDAGELVMIVDACHSAASVQNQEFKPGPMGSRGLGQLAYDKGMRILAASQRDQYALETEKTQHGLLSYALVQEGLEEHAAAKDGRIELSGWLAYGSERVPKLYDDYRTGKLKPKAAIPLDAPTGNFVSLQQPALFDFARGRDMTLHNVRASSGRNQ